MKRYIPLVIVIMMFITPFVVTEVLSSGVEEESIDIIKSLYEYKDYKEWKSKNLELKKKYPDIYRTHFDVYKNETYDEFSWVVPKVHTWDVVKERGIVTTKLMVRCEVGYKMELLKGYWEGYREEYYKEYGEYPIEVEGDIQQQDYYGELRGQLKPVQKVFYFEYKNGKLIKFDEIKKQ